MFMVDTGMDRWFPVLATATRIYSCDEAVVWPGQCGRRYCGNLACSEVRPERIINCARGGLIDEQALADTLRSGHLGGAATDVLISEPPSNDNPLLAADVPRLIVTPHSAWGSREARQRIVGQLRENAEAFFAGTPKRQVG